MTEIKINSNTLALSSMMLSKVAPSNQRLHIGPEKLEELLTEHQDHIAALLNMYTIQIVNQLAEYPFEACEYNKNKVCPK